MDEYEDHADLDGDGEFDGIDIAFLEGEDSEKKTDNGKSGCCFVLFLVGGSIGTGLWWVGNYFV